MDQTAIQPSMPVQLPLSQIVRDEETLLRLLPNPGDLTVLDLETSSLSPYQGHIVGIAVRHPTARFYIPIGHTTGGFNLSSGVQQAFIKRLHEVKLVNQNILFDLKWFRHHWKELFKPYSDTMVLGHFENSNKPLKLKGVDGLVHRYLGEERANRAGYEDIVPEGCSIADVDVEIAAKYAINDVDDAWDLFYHPVLHPFTETFLHSVELELIYRLVDIELRGLRIDRDVWLKLKTDLAVKVQNQKDACAKHLGIEVNPDSPAQVKAAFIRLDIQLPQAQIDGSFSISQKMLKHSKDNPIIKDYLEYKQTAKLFGSYLEGFEKYVRDDEEGCTAPINYLPVLVPTGRMGMAKPSLHNLPKKEHIRNMFVPRKGFYFVEADYSQIELRILASESGAVSWIEAFEKGVDLHRKMGSLMLRKPEAEIDDEERRYCKTINFGVAYGMNKWSLSQQLGIDPETSQNLLTLWFEAVPEIVAYISRQHQLGINQGYIDTKFGRRRWVPEARSRDYKERGFGLRTAVNTHIQGTAADINKIGLIRLCKRAIPRGIWPLVNVHDSNLMEVPESIPIEEVTALVKDAMIFPIDGYCKIDVDIKTGKSWGELQELKKAKVLDDNGFSEVVGKIKDCTKCTCRQEAKQPVTPAGLTTAKVMVVGRNPGQVEDDTGIPFNPQAPGGGELTDWLGRVGLTRETVWVTNAVKCHTAWDRQPTVNERKACQSWLDQEIKFIKPKLIIALGNDALKALTGDETLSMTQKSGEVIDHEGRRIFCLYHPGSTLRNGNIKEQVLTRDLPRLKAVLETL